MTFYKHQIYIVPVLLSVCMISCRGPSPEDVLLDRIEQNVHLPQGAGPMDKYARYYAFANEKQVSALYVIQSDLYVRDADTFCKHNQVTVFPCGPKAGQTALVLAGERKWLKSPAELPIPNGGGCQAITFSYDVDRRSFTDVRCNGSN